MKRRQGDPARGGRGDHLPWHAPIRRRAGAVVAGLVLLGLLAGDKRVAAQTQMGMGEETPAGARLTVRPHAMAIGTTNPPAGEYALDSVPDYLVTIPPQCAGAHRCPLLVALPRGNTDARTVMDETMPTAAYGIILLVPTLFAAPFLDAGLRETLGRFAIDPDKIAIIGHCSSGMAATYFGLYNLDVFSRIGAISGFGVGGTAPVASKMAPPNTPAKFYYSFGVLENGGADEIALMDTLQRRGHPTTWYVLGRTHTVEPEDYHALGQWLRESWDMAPPTKPQVVADPLPVLTTDIVAQMTAFWAKFTDEPDSIRVTARMAHQRDVVFPFPANHQVSMGMADIPALAAKYPSVAADLARAHLTARQHEAYRVAIASARIWMTLTPPDTASMPPALAQNIAFVRTHPDELQALEEANMFTTQ